MSILITIYKTKFFPEMAIDFFEKMGFSETVALQ